MPFTSVPFSSPSLLLNGDEASQGRRRFLKTLACSAASGLACVGGPAAADGVAAAGAVKGRRKHLLLTGCRHDINIGDQAHAPGMLRLIQSHLPGVEATLLPVPSGYGPDWPPDHLGRRRQLDPGLRAMLQRAFPDVQVLAPLWAADDGDRAASDQLDAAFRRADLLVSGSGGGIKPIVRDWQRRTGKPWGAYGVTVGTAQPWYGEAAFIFGRDTPSVSVLERAGLAGPAIALAPDATFAMDLRDEAQARRFLDASGLEDRRFLCVVPRLRYSPYPEMYGYEPSEQELQRAKVNREFKEADHAAMRELIVAWVRRTGWKVLACPEMSYGVPLAKEQLVDPLPDDVRANVVWRDSFWLCDEAASVFARASAMVSLDCHSPILALAAGTPAIHLRLPTDNPFKSRMFADIGLPEWIEEGETMTGERLIRLVMDIVDDHDTATHKVQRALAVVRERQQATMQVLRKALWG